MRYPVFTYGDGTEVTASKPDADGNILLYVERFDAEKDTFVNATIILPSVTVKASYGYDDKELQDIVSNFSEIKDDICDYVMEKVKRSA